MEKIAAKETLGKDDSIQEVLDFQALTTIVAPVPNASWLIQLTRDAYEIYMKSLNS
jgi:hypothetical protein